jgi:hypothetical protein
MESPHSFRPPRNFSDCWAGSDPATFTRVLLFEDKSLSVCANFAGRRRLSVIEVATSVRPGNVHHNPPRRVLRD